MKECSTCHGELPDDEFYKTSGLTCKSCAKIYARQRTLERLENPEYREKHNARRSLLHFKNKLQVIEKLGAACANCGEIDPRILQVNHLNGGGRRELENGTWNFLKKIIDGNRSIEDLDLRCANCNILYEYEVGRRRDWTRHSEK